MRWHWWTLGNRRLSISRASLAGSVGVERKALRVGDYTVAGLEDTCTVQRKDLADLIHSFTVDRPAFVNRLRLMSSFPYRLVVISAAAQPVKSPYPHSNVNPNARN
jgi:ERCC4-type nuclease